MAWFKIDDGFHQHPKVKRAGNAPVGLWIRCATWSSQYLTDGHIPTEIAQDYGRKNELEALVSSRLWLPTDDGFVMPDYLDYNPSKADVERRRKQDAERKRRGSAGVDPFA